jgi:hypothetical protein
MGGWKVVYKRIGSVSLSFGINGRLVYMKRKNLVHMYVPVLLLTRQNDMSTSSYSSLS